MSNLLNDLSSGKTAYQAFTIEHGIEKILVKVPLKNSQAFDQELTHALFDGDVSKAAILQILESHGGSLRKGRA